MLMLRPSVALSPFLKLDSCIEFLFPLNCPTDLSDYTGSTGSWQHIHTHSHSIRWKSSTGWDSYTQNTQQLQQQHQNSFFLTMHVSSVTINVVSQIFLLVFLCSFLFSQRKVPHSLWTKKTPLTLSCLSHLQVIEFDDGSGSVLRIQPLRTPRDEAIYECVASNSVGEISATTRLTVLRGTCLSSTFKKPQKWK